MRKSQSNFNLLVVVRVLSNTLLHEAMKALLQKKYPMITPVPSNDIDLL